jgi:hypothetical protein
LVSNVNSFQNEFERVLTLLSELAERHFLVVNEDVQVVKLLGDIGQQVVANLINFPVDFSLALLEDLDLSENRVALFATEFSERIAALRFPVVFHNTRLDVAIKFLEMLLEKVAFVVVDEVLDVVVQAYDSHYVLT